MSVPNASTNESSDEALEYFYRWEYFLIETWSISIQEGIKRGRYGEGGTLEIETYIYVYVYTSFLSRDAG